MAQSDGTLEVEASPEVILHFQKDGVGDVGYFWYQGVRVYERGKRAAAMAKDALTADQLNFPKRA